MASSDIFCSDDELPNPESIPISERLSWRNEQSFSDWTIVVTTATATTSSSAAVQKSADYHVHKAFLAVGPCRSEYFMRLFCNGNNFAESQDNTSRIELNELAAKAFPDFLDYMYIYTSRSDADHSPSLRMTPRFTTDNATALYSLAKYFDVRRLRHDAKKFCLHDLHDLSKCGTYYEHATLLHEESILEPAKMYCRASLNSISVDSRLLHVPDPQFWIDSMEEHLNHRNHHRNGRLVGPNISKLLACFCKNHNVSPEVFQQLTSENYLTDMLIDPLAAIQLLDLELKIVGSGSGNCGGDGNTTTFSNLQERCMNAIARNNNNGPLLNQEFRGLLQTLPPLLLTEIISRLFVGGGRRGYAYGAGAY